MYVCVLWYHLRPCNHRFHQACTVCGFALSAGLNSLSCDVAREAIYSRSEKLTNQLSCKIKLSRAVYLFSFFQKTQGFTALINKEEAVYKNTWVDKESTHVFFSSMSEHILRSSWNGEHFRFRNLYSNIRHSRLRINPTILIVHYFWVFSTERRACSHIGGGAWERVYYFS